MHLSTGGRLGRYEIVEPLGAGGMGEVYRARDRELDRDVAVKVLPEAVARDPDRLARFKREAKAVARLSHPSILEIYDLGREGDVAFAVTELLEGEDLGDHLGSVGGPMSWKEVRRIGAAVADGLAAAQGNGVVHRDLKPSNIMICSDGRVKILDFGLARFHETTTPEAETASATPALSMPGTVMGTVGYMSPEQVRGEAADARSDIFSLGCVLYEMLSGRRTFKHDTSAETMTAILREEPESFAEIGVDVAPEVAQIVERCLEKNPDQRFQSAADLAFALRGAATDTGLPVTSSRPASGGRRGWWMLAAAAAAVAVVLVGVYVLAPGLLPFAGGPGSAIRSLAVLPLENLTGDAAQEYFADGMTEALITDLSKIGALTVISRTSVMPYKGTGMSLPEIARELGVDALVEGSVQREGNIVLVTAQLIEAATDRHLWADRFERELTSILSLQGEVARAIAGEIEIQLTPQESERLTATREINPETFELYLKGSFELNKGTPEGYRNGLGFFHQAVEADPTDPLAYAALGEAYVNLGHGTQARIEFFPRARAAAQRALELDPMNARASSVLADVMVYYEWNFEEAEAAFQRALQLDSNLPWAHFHYSWYLAKYPPRLEEAIAEHERAKELDPLVPVHTALLGWLYLYDGRLDEAMDEVRGTFELDPNNPWGFMIAAEVHSARQQHQEAIEAARRAVEANPDLRFVLARAYAFAGRDDEARALLAEIESEEMTLWGGFTTPSIYVALGDADGAFRTLEQGYEIRSPWLPWIGVDFLYEQLRGDPRLADLMRRME